MMQSAHQLGVHGMHIAMSSLPTERHGSDAWAMCPRVTWIGHATAEDHTQGGFVFPCVRGEQRRKGMEHKGLERAFLRACIRMQVTKRYALHGMHMCLCGRSCGVAAGQVGHGCANHTLQDIRVMLGIHRCRATG